MDHLPLPHKPILDPIEVPYRCAEPYDKGPFMSFPERHGWDVQYSTLTGIRYRLCGEEPSRNKYESFLQNWLYFGVLHEAFGAFGVTNNFIKKNDNGEMVVTTAAHLGDCCARWVDSLKEAKSKDDFMVTKPWSRINQVIRHSSSICRATMWNLGDAIDPRIWLSIEVLGDCLEKTLYDVFFEDDFDNAIEELMTPYWKHSIHSPPVVTNIILDSMRKNGWCPFDLKAINATATTIAMLYYIGNLQAPRSGANHTNCTSDICTSMTIDSSYQTAHRSPDCGCTGTFSGIDGASEVLKGENIPLIQAVGVKESSEPPVSSFRIVESDKQVKFAAISHVWAEGLGNPSGNSLPVCSLEWVSELVNRLPGNITREPVPFWLDTICVPIQPKEMHIRAMNRLREPYQNALDVLVLDSYLYTQDSSQLSFLEIMARVVCCSWSRRLWTLQEGRLAPNLWFQFADKAVLLEQVWLDMRAMNLATVSLETEIVLAYHGSNIMVKINEQIFKENPVRYRLKPDVRDTREALKVRALSVASDEALCLFCIMKLDMKLVTGLAPEERMAKFWSEMREIPLGLVFSTSKKKLSEPGLRWAPASFMSELDTAHWYIEQCLRPRRDGYPSPDGLRIQAPGFFFNHDLLLHDHSFETFFSSECVFQASDKTWYMIEGLDRWHQDRNQNPLAGQQLVLLTVQSTDLFHRDANLISHELTDTIHAVIGAITKTEDMSYFAGYKHAVVQKLLPEWQQFYQFVAQCVESFVRTECGASEVSGGAFGGQKQEPFIQDERATEERGNDQDNTGNATDLPSIHTCTSLHVESSHERIQDDRDGNADHDFESETKYDNNDSSALGTDSSALIDVAVNEQHETPETFMITDDRRNRCQAFATQVAFNDDKIRNVITRLGRNNNKSEEKAIDHFALNCRFQLQMRLRNQIEPIDQKHWWCID